MQNTGPLGKRRELSVRSWPYLRSESTTNCLETLSAGLEAQPKWLRAFFTTLRDSFNSYDLHDIMKDLFIDEHYLTKADIRR